MRMCGGSNEPGSLRLAFAACALAACGDVTGGAAELSWKLRPASSALEAKFVDCASDQDGTGPVEAIRLHWDVGGVLGEEQWSCGDSHGVTGFALPAGVALFSVEPICLDGPARASSYIAPAAEQRTVIVGNTVSLGAVELVVQVSDCATIDCICE
jgi:hypothetical protein